MTCHGDEGRRRVRPRLAERGCDAPEGGGARRELVREKESDAGREKEKETEWRSEQKEKEIDVCVCVLVLGEHGRTENTCRRRTRADGEHERRQRPAVGQREKGSRVSLFFSFIHLGIVCICCGRPCPID